MILLGKQAIDNDMNATGQMLAALLGWSSGNLCLEALKSSSVTVARR